MSVAHPVAAADPATAAHTPDARPKPVIEIEGGPGSASIASLRELWQFREVLLALVRRQVKVKYKQSILGIGWSVVQPVLAAALFALFLGRFANVSSDGQPYFLFALAGMVGWTYFSTAAGLGVESLTAGQVLLRKVYFPREVLPLSSVASGLIDFVPALTTLAVAAAVYGVTPSTTWLAIPVCVLLLVLLAAAFGLGLGALNVYYRDVRYVLPFMFQVGLFVTPVVYPLSAVPDGWREAYAIGNPAAAAIDGIRRTMIEGEWPQLGITFGALAWALVLVAGTYALFKRLERGFADRV